MEKKAGGDFEGGEVYPTTFRFPHHWFSFTTAIVVADFCVVMLRDSVVVISISDLKSGRLSVCSCVFCHVSVQSRTGLHPSSRPVAFLAPTELEVALMR